MDTGVTPTEALGRDHGVQQSRNETSDLIMTNDNGKPRIAYCECGAQLAGNSERELFDAVQRHLAHHHPRLLGALGVETVHQMAEALQGH